jgi:hypothetical protein
MSGARLAPAEIAAQLAGRIEDLAVTLVGEKPTSRSGREIRFRRRGSLAIVTAGTLRGAYHDHEAGAGGDALDLVRYLRGGTTGEAMAWAVAWLDGAPAATPRAREPTPRHAPAHDTTDLARRLWAEALPAAGTLVEAYLRSRRLVLPEDAPIRFHARCLRGAERLPAMLALMTDPITGKARGIHRTCLHPDGAGKAAPGPNGEPAKMMAGQAGVIRLVPDDEVTLGLGIAEGIETALAVMQRTSWAPVWAATSAGGIRSFPVLAGIGCLTIFSDADGPGMAAARRCRERWIDAGREARIIAPPIDDWDTSTRGDV